MKFIPLVQICDFQGGSQPPKDQWLNQERDGYIRMLQIRDFTQPDKDNVEYVRKTKSIKTCNEDDILIGRYGASVGKILTGLAGAYNVAIVKTIPDVTRLSKRFLYYYLNSPYFQNYILSVGSRAAQAGFNKDDLSDAVIPLLSLEEQNDVVEKLDQVDGLISMRKEQLAKLDELVKVRFVEMFGSIDKSCYVTMASVCSIITDGTHQPPKFISNGIPFLFVSNITTNEITYDAQKFISAETYNELIKRTPIEIGDILLSTVGSYGHPAVVRETKPFCFQRHIAYLKPNQNLVDSDYLHGAILSWDVQRQIEEKVKGIAQKTLNLSEIRTLRFPLPDMEQQKRFAAYSAQIKKTKLTIQASLDKLEVMKKALMQEYFG